MKHIKLYEAFENLEPDQVWYHGRTQEITDFKKSLEFLSKDNNDEHGPGIYLTTDQKDAKGYGNFIHVVKFEPTGEIIKRGDKIKSTDFKIATKIIKDFGNEWEMEANNWHQNPSQGIKEFLNSISKSSNDRVDFYEYVWADYFRYTPRLFVDGMVANGIDGLIIPGYAGTEGMTHLVAYNTDALKIQNV